MLINFLPRSMLADYFPKAKIYIPNILRLNPLKRRRNCRGYVRVKRTFRRGLELIKVANHYKDGSWKEVPASRSHRDKQVNECV